MQLITAHPQAHIVTASKELIDSLLTMNTNNRSPKPGHIDVIKKEIIDNEWFLTASGIGVSNTGVLLDGQHRCMAIRDAGYPAVQILLMTGLEEEGQKVVDRHAKRNLSDVLSLYMDIHVTTNMVAVVQAITSHKLFEGKKICFASSTKQLRDSRVAEFLTNHSEIIVDVLSAAKNPRAPISAALFVYAYFEREKAMEFCHQIAKGLGLQEDDPAYRLRLAIDRNAKNGSAPGRLAMAQLTASAIIAHSQGRKIKTLKPVLSWETASWKWPSGI